MMVIFMVKPYVMIGSIHMYHIYGYWPHQDKIINNHQPHHCVYLHIHHYMEVCHKYHYL